MFKTIVYFLKIIKFMETVLNKEISIAPMMKWTDRHCRFFHRQFSKSILLYTEMISSNAVMFGNRKKLLAYNDEEHPVAIQLGGSNPSLLGKAAKICEKLGYDEINLNVGCPSPKVKAGRFGACLMAEPKLVKECLEAMKNEVNVPISVKCRIGIDDMDEITGLDEFVDQILEAGISKIIVHARKAFLKGLNPKQNREVPPINYQRVKLLKNRLNNNVKIIVNGGINSMKVSEKLLKWADGIMVGRQAYRSPLIIHYLDQFFFKSYDHYDHDVRINVTEKIVNYANQCIKNDKNFKLNHITRHMLGLYAGLPGGKIFRQKLNEISINNNEPTAILDLSEKIETIIKSKNLMVA